VQDVALWLSLPPARVQRLARAGKIPHLELPGGGFVFDPVELTRWVESLRSKGRSPEVTTDA
jgi:hypothetical protein